MKKKIILLLVSIVLEGSNIAAQSLSPAVIASSGGYYSSATGSLSATMCEMTMVQTFTSIGNILTQGFQQPEEWYASVNEQEQSIEDVSVYPNPSNGKFNINVNSQEKGSAQIYLYDILGQKSFSGHMDIGQGLNTKNIDIRSYAIGIYFLEYIYIGDNEKKDSRVIKVNLVY